MPSSRRSLLRFATIGATSTLLPRASTAAAPLATRRPPPAQRKFTSEAVEETIRTVKARIKDPELAWLFENCFPNTLDTTVHTGTVDGKPDSFVITGDIEAMWLRDSSAQVWPYLPLCAQDVKLRTMVAGLIRRQARCILIDPYANAFNFDGSKPSEWASDETAMRNELHERKWEVDSLCYPIRLAHGYWKATGDVEPFDARFLEAMGRVITTLREQQRKKGPGPYKFRRKTKEPTDSLPGDGFGNPTRPNGLIHSAFRPSDDACTFPYLIPSNFFAVAALTQLHELATALGAKPLAAQARELADEVRKALLAEATATHAKAGRIWAYEVDGFGNHLFMDDANVPSLLGLPYLGACAVDDPTYVKTRAFVLSDDNPYFSRGRAAEGVGGPHVGVGMIWPLGITMRALTSTDDKEILSCLRTLVRSHAGTGFMHESFSKDDPKRFTRPWFAWANTLFGELVLKVSRERAHLLGKPLG